VWRGRDVSTGDPGSTDPTDAEKTYTRLISRTFVLEGVTFSWWAIDNSPTLVTVSSDGFGRKANVTDSDPEATAKLLAMEILQESDTRVVSTREPDESNRAGSATSSSSD
jgi:hypothetical protein